MFARSRSLLAVLAVLALLSLAALIGCAETTEVKGQKFTWGDEGKTPEEKTEVKVDPNRPLPPYATVSDFPSGDTIELVGGRLVRLMGVRAPGVGENCYQSSKNYLRQLIGRQIVRLVYREGTVYGDPIWHANVLIPNPNDATVRADGQEGVVAKGRAAVSVNCLLLSQGLVWPDGIGDMKYSRQNEKGESLSMSDEENAAIRALFEANAKRGKENKVFLYGKETRP